MFKRKKKAKPSPLTPWERYRVKHERQEAHKSKKKKPVNLPEVAQLRRRTLRRNLLIVLTPLVLGLAFFAYMASPIAKVQQISVVGARNVPIQNVIDASKLDSRDSLLGSLINKNATGRRIKDALPEIKSAEVEASGMSAITIKVTEYQPIGYVFSKQQYHLILENGRQAESGSETPQLNLPVLEGFSTAEATAIAKLIAQFPKAVREATSEVKATKGNGNPYQIELTMTDGNRVIADSRTIVDKIRYYPMIVGETKTRGTVDLEVGAFFTPAQKK